MDAPSLSCRSQIEMFGRISRERLVSVDAKLSLGALDFSPLHHSLAVTHKTPIIISNYRADDPSMGNFGKISRMGWFLQSANRQLNPTYGVGFNCVVSEIDYVWGNDISGARDGACGIGGLLYLKRNGFIYIPFYDAYGNVLGYTDAHGNVVAEYTYDPFGKIVGKAGAMADDFVFRFSTKYYDVETDLYYYIYRYYKPNLMRWLTEDPIAEDGGLNLYGFCGNNPVCRYDKDGRAYFAVRGLGPILTPLKWSDIMSGLRSAICPFASFSQRERDVLDNAADFNNIEILHEQLFFEDGGDIKSIGWGNENGGSYMYNENPNRYTKTDVGYDDCIMRLAVAEVSPTHYQLTWIGSKSKCNCQDYASALRAKYRELENNPEVKCRCKKGNFK